MKKYILKKVISAIGLLFIITIVVFVLMNFQPGNPYIDRLNPSLSKEAFEEALRKLGYYDPIHVKYIKWLTQLLKGNLGYSIKHGQEVGKLIASKIGNTLVLVSVAFIISSISGIYIGIRTSASKSLYLKKFVNIFTVMILSMPTFFVGILLIKWFSYDLNLLPNSGMYSLQISKHSGIIEKMIDIIKHMIMPIIVLVLMNLPAVIQYSKTSMDKVIIEDYIKMAKSKGLSEKIVLWKHGFRNMAIPIVALLSLQAPIIFSGAMVTETVFSYPGIGKLGFDAVMGRDYPLVMGILLMNTIVVLLANLSADIIYGFLDPRISIDSKK